jgi:hypothetical protein
LAISNAPATDFYVEILFPQHHMILLDTGIGLVVYGTPVLAIILTLIVSLIESFYLNRFVKNFWKTYKTATIVNFISTVIGFVAIALINLLPLIYGFRLVPKSLGLTLKTGHGIGGYIGRLLLIVVFYLLTLLIEIPLFKLFLKNSSFGITNKIIVANLLSYLLITILFLAL